MFHKESVMRITTTDSSLLYDFNGFLHTGTNLLFKRAQRNYADGVSVWEDRHAIVITEKVLMYSLIQSVGTILIDLVDRRASRYLRNFSLWALFIGLE